MTDTDRQGTSNARPGFDESLEESVGFLLSDTARHIKRLLYQRLASHGVRNGAWFVLRALWEREGLTQRELADRLGMTAPSMLQMLRAMEADGLVRFEKDPGGPAQAARVRHRDGAPEKATAAQDRRGLQPRHP